MTTQHRQQLSRLHIPGPPNQQPLNFEAQSMFSPAIPTGVPHGYPAYSLNTPGPLQTPMQTSFFTHQQGTRRPAFAGHSSRPSLANLAAVGIQPTMGVPMTPLGQNQFPPQMMLNGGPPFAQPFTTRNRRAPSISTGGPPKAPLGGPGRKHSPMPPAATAAAGDKAKVKKVVVNFPVETIPGEDGASADHPLWARMPLQPALVPTYEVVQPKDISTAEIYPPDEWRTRIPDSVDVFLPGKGEWETIKRSVIEEKLQQLGVEKGSGSNLPHIYAPHARAASISSPADPQLLLWKLNKLQQSQQGPAGSSVSGSSLSTSPQPPILTPSPIPPRFQQGRHGHSMSLAQPPSYQQPLYNPTAAFNPFGPSAILGSDLIKNTSISPDLSTKIESIFAPQGHVPVPMHSLAPPPTLSRPDSRESRPDFSRGFGLDITEEEDEGMDEDAASVPSVPLRIEDDVALQDSGYMEEGDGLATASQSAMHSRHVSHVSRVSVTLSLRSVGGKSDQPAKDGGFDEVRVHSPGDVQVDDIDGEAVGEWTGSEDMRADDVSEDEQSIGEWSNPSDEERARQERVQRRLLRRAQQETEMPRRLPNFPQPPSTGPVDVAALRRDDDEFSNPSDEEYPRAPDPTLQGMIGPDGYYQRPSSNGSANRPLPPLPHSRDVSGQSPIIYNADSGEFHYPLAPRPPTKSHAPPASDAPRKDSLNPLAKPFVFGARPSAGSQWTLFGHASMSSHGADAYSTPPSHSRTLSSGKPLNAAAAEFVPSFTFRPPPGVPALSFPQPEPVASRPLPEVPVSTTPARAAQGREKRQRRGSSGDLGSDEGDRSKMFSFKFPPDDSPQSVRRSAPVSPTPRRQNSLNASAKPFTFSGYSNLTLVPSLSLDQNAPAPAADNLAAEVPTDVDESFLNETAQADYGDSDSPSQDFSLPMPAPKSKRAPIPLDFKHPVSTNMVPAGLFKALGNSDDERTRASVRSRLSSREIFEHVVRPSLDDSSVLSISRKTNRSRLATDPEAKGRWVNEPLDLFNPIANDERRPSLPLDSRSSRSTGSIVSMNVAAARAELTEYEGRLEALLDEKISSLRDDLAEIRHTQPTNSSSKTEAMVSEVLSLFRAQLQDSVARSLEDSQMDARGEMDFELIKDIVDQGHKDACLVIQRDLFEAVQQLKAHNSQPAMQSNELAGLIEEMTNRTINAVVGMASNLVSRLESLNAARPSSAMERDLLLRDMMTTLTPVLSSLRPEPIDYEGLTHQLTQAVKPHISQLIDLASDKRETAGMIVDCLIPILPTLQSPAPTIDTDAVVSQLKADIHRIVAPIDAHVIKEQVADLVVERLDSRLAVRDRSLNADTIATRVAEGVSHLLDPVNQVLTTVGNVAASQQMLSSQNQNLVSIHHNVVDLLSDLPAKLAAATEAFGTAQASIQYGVAVSDGYPHASESIANIEASIESLASGQGKLLTHSEEIVNLHQQVLDRLRLLPESVENATKVLQSAHADMLQRNTSKQESDELRKLKNTNTDLQVQVAKARGAHGQVRVEKDQLSERLAAAEAERERLRAQVDSMQHATTAKESETVALEARNSELEEALAQALARLKTSDVAAQAHQERISDIEKANRELVQEKQHLKSKVDSLELQATFAVRDKEAASQVLERVERERDHLVSQQSHWDDLRRAAEHIETLTHLVGQVESDEVNELKRIRDRSKVLEGEHAALQKRFKEQEIKLANVDKASLTARQNLAQAQQRSSEWEKRAKEFEGELEMTRTKLDQADQTHAQLDADYSLAKLQLEERESEHRLTKDRESKLCIQVVSLEAQIARFQVESDQTKAIRQAEYPSNGRQPQADSRASSVYTPSRSGTPTAHLNGKSNTQTSVWDSMHAPQRYSVKGPTTPKARQHSGYYRTTVPSPTPSTVSLTPTQGEDGWWQ